jgi:hypothetical protein
MHKINKYAASLVLAAGLAGSASGQDAHWTGLNGNAAWNNLNNWDIGVPNATTKTAWLDIANGQSVMTIPAATTQNVGTSYIGDGVTFSTIFGPEWGATLNIHGTLNYDWMMYPVGSTANPSTINMDGNSHLSGVNLGIGNSWWFHDGPYVTMNVSDNSAVNIAWLYWGGHLNLFGGTFTINGGVNEDVLGLTSDATRLMNITGGKLVLGFGDQTALVNGWISKGILQAYGGTGNIIIDTTTLPGSTILTAVVPEPSSMALLGLGGFAAMFSLRRRSRSVR